MAAKQKDYDFIDPLPEECPCLVCLEVQVDPHQVTCCGKIFCKSCLDKLIWRRQNCPNCRKNLDNRYFPDLNTERKIKQLRVRCENQTRGCKWVGCMKDLKHVHIPKCPNHLVPCTNIRSFNCRRSKRCGYLIQRCDLDKHMTQLCEWRQVECTHCRLKDNYRFINGEHIRNCQEFPINCTNNGCQIKMKRKNLREHQTACPKQIVSCRYSSVGCKARITKENIVYHNQKYMEQHLDSAVDTVEKTSDTLDQTVHDLKECLKRIRTLEKKVSRKRSMTSDEEEDGYSYTKYSHRMVDCDSDTTY